MTHSELEPLKEACKLIIFNDWSVHWIDKDLVELTFMLNSILNPKFIAKKQITFEIKGRKFTIKRTK